MWGWASKNFTTTISGDPITVENIDGMVYELYKQETGGVDCEVSCVYAEVAWNYLRPFEVEFDNEIPEDESIGLLVDENGTSTSVGISSWVLDDVEIYESYTMVSPPDEVNFDNDTLYGQQFTTGETGPFEDFTVVNVSVYLKRQGSPTGDVQLDLFAVDGGGNPTGSSLTGATVDVSSIDTSYAWVDFQVDPVELLAGEMYVLVLNFTGSSDSSNCVNWSCNLDDGTYSGGEMITSSDGGSSWSDTGEEPDALFKIFGTSGSYFDLSFLSNSSDAWQEYGNCMVFENGTYSALNTNFSELSTDYWWKCNATKNGDYVESPLFMFSTRNQSKLVNTGETDIRGYLLMQIQFWNTTQSKWINDTVVVDDELFTIESGCLLHLDWYFNGKVKTSDLVNGDGLYRVYAAFRDPDGETLICDDESLLEAWYEFEVEVS